MSDVAESRIRATVHALAQRVRKMLQIAVVLLSVLAIVGFLAVSLLYFQTWEVLALIPLLAIFYWDMLFRTGKETVPRKESLGEKLRGMAFFVIALVIVGLAATMIGFRFGESAALWSLVALFAVWWLCFVVLAFVRIGQRIKDRKLCTTSTPTST